MKYMELIAPCHFGMEAVLKREILDLGYEISKVEDLSLIHIQMCIRDSYGTTHADYIYGEVPCVRNLTKEEIEEAYEKNTGVLIADYFRKLDYEAVPAVLCKNHRCV